MLKCHLAKVLLEMVESFWRKKLLKIEVYPENGDRMAKVQLKKGESSPWHICTPCPLWVSL